MIASNTRPLTDDRSSSVKPDPQQVVGVVRQREIGAQPIGSDGAGFGAVLCEDDGLFGQQQRDRRPSTSLACRVWSGVPRVRMRAAGTRCGQLQHLRTEGGKHPVLDGHRLLGGRPVRRGTTAWRPGAFGSGRAPWPSTSGAWLATDTQEKTLTVRLGQGCVPRRYVGWFVHPEVQDAGGDDRVFGRRQQVVDRIEGLDRRRRESIAQ